MNKFSCQLQHDVEIEFSVLDLALQNQVQQTWDTSFLNSLKTILTNEYVWKIMLFWRKKNPSYEL